MTSNEKGLKYNVVVVDYRVGLLYPTAVSGGGRSLPPFTMAIGCYFCQS
jgi:hypothetical protein